MSQPTNAPVAMDQRTFGRMFLGRQPGQRVSGEQLENDRKQYEYFVKKSVDEYFKSQQGGPSPDRPVDVGYITNAPRVTMDTDAAGNVITNTNSGPIVHQVEKFSDGTFRIIPPSVQNFRGGSGEVVAPGTTRYFTNEQTGATEQNYSSEYSDDAGAATIGAYNAGPGATTPVAPPVTTTVNTTTAPTVAPPPAAMPQANQMVRVISPDGKRGSIPASQVDQALQQGFRLVP